MANQEIKGNDYLVVYNEKEQTVFFQGTLRLKTTNDYEPVSKLLKSIIDVVGKQDPILTLDFRELKFINSSGIHALSRFVIDLRKSDQPIRVVGNPKIYWQKRSLINFSKLWPKVQVDLS